MPLSGNGDQDDAPHINALITGASSNGLVEIPHTGAGFYRCNTAVVVPSGVHLRPGPKSTATAYNAFLWADRTGYIVEFDDSAGNPNHCNATLEGFTVTNAGSGGAIKSQSDVLFQGRLLNLLVGGGATAPVIDLAAQSAVIDGLRVFGNIADGGLLGHTLLKLTGNDNHVYNLVTNESARSGAGWTNGSPLVHFSTGGNNTLEDSYLETTWGNGQTGYHILLDAADVTLRGVRCEPHLSGTGAITSTRSISLTNTSSLVADTLGFLGDNGVTSQGKLYIDATSAAHINYWSILTSLTNVCEFASSTAGRITARPS
jgi:hypothetical protein